MFLSGHPLDHYRFEMKHYGVTSVAEFNDFRDSIRLQPNPGRMFRVIALVSGVDHRTAQNGNKFGRFILEDYSGKTEVSLFREDYQKLSPFLTLGTAVFITGYFKPRYNKEEFEFKISTISLAETMKKTLTKQLSIEVHPQDIKPEMIEFVEKNLKYHRGGSTGLKFVLKEPKSNLRISLVTGTNGFEMNEEMIGFLENRLELDVQVLTN